MNFGLSEEQEMIVNTVRSFVEKEIYPHEDLVEQAQRYPAKSPRTSNKKPLIWVFTRATFPNLWAQLVFPMLILPWSSASWAEARWR